MQFGGAGGGPDEVRVNVALTARLLVIVSVQVGAVPLQSPPQPANVEPAAGCRGQRDRRGRGVEVAAHAAGS